jgi:glucokinase
LSEDCSHHILVFDVGGSHVAASVFNPDSMSLGKLGTVPVLETGGTTDFFAAFESLANIMLAAFGPLAGAAVAIPNPFDYDRGVSYMQHKHRHLYGSDLRGELANRFGCDPVRVHFLNDAAAFLIGELYQGAAAGASRVIGIALGTGVGSAFAVDNKIVVQGGGVPPGGEIWNLPYRESIIENFISTLAIQRLYHELSGTRAEVRDIAALASTHEPARQTFELFGSELGKVLREICFAFNPERIVFGGGISRAAEFFLPAAEKELAGLSVQLRVSNLFERAPLIGAGVSWKQKYVNGKEPRQFEQSSVAEEA